MATKLRKLRVTRVDRVWAPANGTPEDGPLARIVLAKAKAPKANPNHDHSEIAPGERCTGCGYVQPMEKSDTGGDMPTESEQHELHKTDEAETPPTEPATTEPTETDPADAPAEEPAADVPAEDDSEDEDVDKAQLPASVRKRLERFEAMAKAAEAEVAKMRDEAEAKRWLEVAKGLPYVAVAKKVGGDAAADTGRLLHSIAKAAGEPAATQLVAVLEAAQTRLAQSELLKEKGANGTGTLGSAGAQLEKAADQIRKDASEAGTRLTPQQAYQRAVSANPELALKAQEEDLTRA